MQALNNYPARFGDAFIGNQDGFHWSHLSGIPESTEGIQLWEYLKQKDHKGLAADKPVFGISGKVRYKQVCSATETS